jgi:hypothetical protein
MGQRSPSSKAFEMLRLKTSSAREMSRGESGSPCLTPLEAGAQEKII